MASAHHLVVVDKLNEFYEQGVPAVFERDLSLGPLQEPARSNLVQAVVGVRRCGKTYRLYQEMHRILEAGYDLDSILYFNFDDERLKPYETALLDDVVESFYARNPQAKQQGAFFFFDEVQEIPDWGAFMRRMVDTQVATIYVTGSSSKMLSLDLATEFRGRALVRELFPMGLAEYARFHGALTSSDLVQAVQALTGSMRARLRRSCTDYLLQGGFIATQQLEPSDATQLLQDYANRTVNYDVIERYGVPNPSAAALFLARCMASSGRELSVNKTYNDFRSRGIAVGREMLSQLLGYYEEAYLLFAIRDYRRSLASNPRSSAKLYAADPALFSAFSPAPSMDTGQRLETAVFNKLRRQVPSPRMGAISRALVDKGAKRYEVDFVVGDALALESIQLIQVAAAIEDERTRSRELTALELAMERFGVRESTLVTADEKGEHQAATGVVRIVPAWEWLL